MAGSFKCSDEIGSFMNCLGVCVNSMKKITIAYSSFQNTDQSLFLLDNFMQQSS
jgi:hypothetical protein